MIDCITVFRNLASLLVFLSLSCVTVKPSTEFGGRSTMPERRFYIGGDDWRGETLKVVRHLRETRGGAEVVIDNRLMPTAKPGEERGDLLDYMEGIGAVLYKSWRVLETDRYGDTQIAAFCLAQDRFELLELLPDDVCSYIARQCWLKGVPIDWGDRLGDSRKIYVAEKDVPLVQQAIREYTPDASMK